MKPKQTTLTVPHTDTMKWRDRFAFRRSQITVRRIKQYQEHRFSFLIRITQRREMPAGCDFEENWRPS
jgi:hypothetical protein